MLNIEWNPTTHIVGRSKACIFPQTKQEKKKMDFTTNTTELEKTNESKQKDKS